MLAASLATVTVPAQQATAQDNVWDRVAQCESSGNWSINTGNGYYGGLQFWHPTWVSFGGDQYAPYAHQATKVQQITIAQKVLRVQGPGAWPVCSVRAGLTMENGLAPYPGQGEDPPSRDTGTGTWYVKATPGANIRSGPGLSYAVIGSASTGTKITGSAKGDWVSMTGGRWISLSTLTSSAPADPAPAPTPPPPSTGSTYVVTATAGANIRSGPGTSYSITGGARYGTSVKGVLSNGWVKLSDGRGYISGSILRASTGTTDPGSMAPLVIDGSRGPLTVKAIQRWAGVAETGVWDTTTIKALQRTVGTTADGSWGPASQRALQDRIGMARDGSTYMNYRTVVELQRWLNANVIG